MEVSEILKERITTYSSKADSFKSKASSLSWARFAVFVFILTDVILLMDGGPAIPFGFFLPLLIALFVWLIVKHRSADYQLKLHRELVAINEEEEKRKALLLKELEDGQVYDEENHPYTIDLDIFGEHSLFQLLNRSPLVNAQTKLAEWMKRKSDGPTIEARQQALTELKEKQEWSQLLMAEARVLVKGKKKKQADKQEVKSLFEWLKKPAPAINTTFLLVMAYLLTASNLITLGLLIFIDLPYQYFVLSFFISMGALGYTFNKCKEMGEELDQSQLIIKAYANLIAAIEQEPFQSPLLKKLRSSLVDGQASESIKVLDTITFRFSSRANMFYALINPLFLLDFHLLIKAVKWKGAQQENIPTWFEVVDEVSTLASLGGFYYLNQDYQFPIVTDKVFTLKGQQIGHPLINPKQRVDNDFELDAKGQVGIITGSNMSGKSTFERTVGINLVLAQMGAPVCAQHFSFHPMEVFTSMRTKDNLEESTSSFYAELKRIRQLLDHVNDHEVTFYVIDEVLKGTNSEDRHKGAVSIASQLSGKNCFGLISTHDLSLSKLAETNDHVRNYSFNSTIEGDQIIFDYRLTEGPCQSFNASKLMENMGIIAG